MEQVFKGVFFFCSLACLFILTTTLAESQCSPPLIPVFFTNDHSVDSKFYPPNCTSGPPDGGQNSATRCWHWDAWSQECRWLTVGQSGGFAKDYYDSCKGAEQIEYGAAHRCVLPPTKQAFLCVDPSLNIHSKAPQCSKGQIAIFINGMFSNCIQHL